LYNGVRFETVVNDDIHLANFYENILDLNLKINEYLILKDADGNTIDKQRWTKSGFAEIKFPKIKEFKKEFAPKSEKQECLFDLVSNNEIPIKLIAGVAGSGKSKVCIKYGLYLLDKGKFSKMFVIRHNVSVGEKNGYLPGDKFEKILGWLGFLEDNLDDVQSTVEELYKSKKIDVDSVEFLKGRDIKNAFILVDEAEDLTVEQFKMIGERVSAGSVICFVGDYEQTSQEKYVKNNGLIRAIENLSGDPLVGVVVFDDKLNDNVRSETSKVFTYKY
jgi:PhoH-like ATPase